MEFRGSEDNPLKSEPTGRWKFLQEDIFTSSFFLFGWKKLLPKREIIQNKQEDVSVSS